MTRRPAWPLPRPAPAGEIAPSCSVHAATAVFGGAAHAAGAPPGRGGGRISVPRFRRARPPLPRPDIEAPRARRGRRRHGRPLAPRVLGGGARRAARARGRRARGGRRVRVPLGERPARILDGDDSGAVSAGRLRRFWRAPSRSRRPSSRSAAGGAARARRGVGHVVLHVYKASRPRRRIADAAGRGGGGGHVALVAAPQAALGGPRRPRSATRSGMPVAMIFERFPSWTARLQSAPAAFSCAFSEPLRHTSSSRTTPPVRQSPTLVVPRSRSRGS